MYTNEDLNSAVDNGIFTATAVDEFRQHIATLKQAPSVDEENFRLISGFNDIFVVIACILLLVSASWVANAIAGGVGMLILALLAWVLAEFFVRKRNMALPAIVLLGAFVGGIFYTCLDVFSSIFQSEAEYAVLGSAAITVVATYIHWSRFKVPITVAAGTVAFIGVIITLVLSLYPAAKAWILQLTLLGGIGTFFHAMYWDAQDRQRITRRADVAFWLHLLAAPMIVHSVFASLGILRGDESLSNIAIILVMYMAMTLVSLIIDRRAFMVSSLIYVLYAIARLLETYGVVGHHFALTGVFIGSLLLILSGFWHTVRAVIVRRLPMAIQNSVPKVK